MSVTSYTCFVDGVDWQHHLGQDPDGTPLFPDVESLLASKTCIEPGGCGIVEVEVRLVRWVREQDLNFVATDDPRTEISVHFAKAQP